MPEAININPIVRKTLIRSFYFAEAMAVYERYYQPLIATFGPAREELTDPGRHEDRPPTWVPLVFHCTTEEKIRQMFQDGVVRPGKNGTVALTEIPIGELDRMKYRHHAEQQVAIGFPRQYIQSLGLTPAWYLKHNPEIVAVLRKWEATDPDGFGTLKPFIDDDDDVAPFQEIRTTAPVSIAEAVWLLTTIVDDNDDLIVPDIDKFKARHGGISQSFWHRGDQMEMLSEWQFTKLKKDANGVLVGFEFRGEYYWRKLTTQVAELSVMFPAHDRNITFEMTKLAEHEGFTGPWRFIDVARSIATVLAEAGEDVNTALRYRLIRDISSL
jgi:hypothetical protein